MPVNRLLKCSGYWILSYWLTRCENLHNCRYVRWLVKIHVSTIADIRFTHTKLKSHPLPHIHVWKWKLCSLISRKELFSKNITTLSVCWCSSLIIIMKKKKIIPEAQERKWAILKVLFSFNTIVLFIFLDWLVFFSSLRFIFWTVVSWMNEIIWLECDVHMNW